MASIKSGAKAFVRFLIALATAYLVGLGFYSTFPDDPNILLMAVGSGIISFLVIFSMLQHMGTRGGGE